MNITTSLPSGLVTRLNEYSIKFNIPKSRILEKALEAYFDRIKRAEYIRSFQMAARDSEVSLMAEEGLEDYLKILGEDETA
jgi:hypothetical protein